MELRCPVLTAFGCVGRKSRKRSPMWDVWREKRRQWTPQRRAAQAVLLVLGAVSLRQMAAHLGVSITQAGRHIDWLVANGHAVKDAQGRVRPVGVA